MTLLLTSMCPAECKVLGFFCCVFSTFSQFCLENKHSKCVCVCVCVRERECVCVHRVGRLLRSWDQVGLAGVLEVGKALEKDIEQL